MVIQEGQGAKEEVGEAQERAEIPEEQEEEGQQQMEVQLQVSGEEMVEPGITAQLVVLVHTIPVVVVVVVKEVRMGAEEKVGLVVVGLDMTPVQVPDQLLPEQAIQEVEEEELWVQLA
jgi:hypothetical protein